MPAACLLCLSPAVPVACRLPVAVACRPPCLPAVAVPAAGEESSPGRRRRRLLRQRETWGRAGCAGTRTGSEPTGRVASGIAACPENSEWCMGPGI
ncbi:MAG: hypothetical protein CBB80_013485 [Synechococcus sp. TMED20]|nr:MAG: hypothetical protein CBB80_013485 [Synechococcus sp. TMED20]